MGSVVKMIEECKLEVPKTSWGNRSSVGGKGISNRNLSKFVKHQETVSRGSFWEQTPNARSERHAVTPMQSNRTGNFKKLASAEVKEDSEFYGKENIIILFRA